MKALVSKFLKDEEGATAIEYGLIAALIAVVVIAAIRTVGTNLSSTFQAIGTNLAPATP
ncbi:MAG: Flp family type IVb pilin [Pseudomonadota bacterium]